MGLQVLREPEVPSEAPPAVQAVKIVEVETAKTSNESSEAFRATVKILAEIRQVLNARAGALTAMAGAFILTTVAMIKGTMMGLGIAVSYDILVFLPIAVIAYLKPKQ